MKKTSILLSVLATASMAQANLTKMSVKEAQNLVSQPTEAIQSVLSNTPTAYDFKNLNGENTVSYTGQSLRQTLINDSKLIFGSVRRGEFKGNKDKAFNTFNSFYEYNADGVKASSKAVNGVTPILVKASDPAGKSTPTLEFFYLDILEGSKNLKGKTAGNDNALRNGKLLGWDALSMSGQNFDLDQDGSLVPDELIQGYMNVMAANAASSEFSFSVPDGMGGEQVVEAAFVTESGLDLAQLTQKVFHGAVSFSQAAGDYMSVDLAPGKGLNASNDLAEGKAYSDLQHHWDEAFGYFGAARNFNELSVLEIRQGASLDSYDEETYVGANAGDGEISILTEKNLGLSTNAAKRDLGAAGKDTNFTRATMDAFLKGRQLVQEKPEGYLEYAQAYSVLAINQWEQVIAATVIHYINETAADLQNYGTADYKFTNLAKHFSEMKGFALAFQFNPNSSVSIEDFKTFHKLVGDTPQLPQDGGVDAYVADLMEARNILQKSFSFSDATVKAW